MASTKTQIKAIRIANETAEYFEGKPLNRYVECLHRLAESGAVVLDGEEVKISGGNTGVNTDGMGYTLAGLEEMASFGGMTLEEFVEQIYGLLEEGMLLIDGSKIVCAVPGWAGEFENVCHDLCVPVEKAAEGAIKALKRGGL